jgi:GntR family transcriptional repressor for pyruvate dehydrogenase complex
VPKISDAIASDLERSILEGSLQPGARLPSERELAAEFGVSRPSLREAIQKLVSRGLLRSRQGGGTFVTDRLGAVFSDPWRDMLAAHPNLREDLLEFRRMLEGQVAEWAAERRTDADMRCLQACFEAMRDAFEEVAPDAWVARDTAFHQAIADAAHNALLAHLNATLLKLMEDDIRVNLTELGAAPRSFALLGTQHRALFEAIRDRNVVAARSAAETHLDFVRESLAQSLRSLARRETAARRLEGAGSFLSP